MKKIIVTTLALTCVAFGALAQGSINIQAFLSNLGGAGALTEQGANATSTTAASTYLNPTDVAGNTISLEVLFSTTATGAEITTIDSYLNQSGGAATALSDLTADGFTEADAAPTDMNVNNGSFHYTANSGIVYLPNVGTDVTGYMALVATELTGASDPGWTGVIAFGNQSSGGNYTTTPAGTAATLTGWNTLDENLVLSPVPEPATLAVAGLGGLSMLLIRRRK